MERGVCWMTAILDQILGSLMLQANLDDLRVLRVVLAEVGAQAALSILYLSHVGCFLPQLSHRRCPIGTGERNQLRDGSYQNKVLVSINLISELLNRDCHSPN